MQNTTVVQQSVQIDKPFTKAEIQAFIKDKPENAISYAVNRNPNTMYKYIKQNYPASSFPNIKPGSEITKAAIGSMYNFLSNAFTALPLEKRAHFIATILQSLPAAAQVVNWTTPKD
ncbi:MAG: hypothetical protein EBX41_00795 [Chitinophagia bacterium]|nr:hypothetical protein [Chitinophagia bacterium]